MKTNVITCTVTVLCIFSALAGCGHYETVTTETYAMDINTIVDISTFNGDVTVEWWDGNEMSLEIRRTSSRSREDLDEAEVTVSTGPVVEVTAIKLSSDAHVGVSFLVQLPEVSGVGHIGTSNGGISVTGGYGDAVLRTSNGKVSVTDFDGTVDILTSNGSIVCSCFRINSAVTSNGSIHAEIRQSVENDLDLVTSNGSVNLKLSEGSDAALVMSTSNGSVSLEGSGFDSSTVSESHGTAIIGGGEAEIVIRASNGNIVVETY